MYPSSTDCRNGLPHSRQHLGKRALLQFSTSLTSSRNSFFMTSHANLLNFVRETCREGTCCTPRSASSWRQFSALFQDVSTNELPELHLGLPSQLLGPTPQQKAPTRARSHHSNISRCPRHPQTVSFPQEMATNAPSHRAHALPLCCTCGQPGTLGSCHAGRVTLLAPQTPRACVCSGTAPARRGFGLCWVVFLGERERKHQFFLQQCLGRELILSN